MMGEAWDDLETFRRKRVECAQGVNDIIAACARDHPHKHVIECRECYQKVLDRMRSRYSDPRPTERWLPEPVLNELDELFTAAKECKVDLAEIDRRVEEERKRSYLHQVKASPSIRKTLEELLNGKELYASIGSNATVFDEVVAQVRQTLRGSGVLNGEAGAEGAEQAVQRLTEAKMSEERLEAYKQTFFLDKPEGTVSEKTQMYLDRLQEGATMDDIVNKISVDRRSSIGAMDRKEMHKKRIEDLRRARAAHELQKSRRAKDHDNVTWEEPAAEELYHQPPCKACGAEVDLDLYYACPLCQILWDAGMREKPVVWDEEKCYLGENGHVGPLLHSRKLSCRGRQLTHKQAAHVQTTHSCTSGDFCVQLTDSKFEPERSNVGPWVCKECFRNYKSESVFCNVLCAHLNFQRHREQVHLPERRRRGIDDRDGEDLRWENEFRQRYYSRDIKAHLLSIVELTADYAKEKKLNEIRHLPSPQYQ